MSDEFNSFFESIATEIDAKNTEVLPTSKWIEKYTSHPIQTSKPWSFKEHEFQIEIVDCESPYIACRKCSQIGVSEIFLRKGLSRCKRKIGTTMIYVFPTTGDVRKLVSHRVDTTIRESQIFKEALNPDLNNLEMKQIDSSFLYFTGSQKVGISVPANLVYVDEVDFCVQKNITTFQSRLGHNKEGDERFVGFSTPTIEGYGIDKMMSNTSESFYAVKHYKCGKTNKIDFFKDIVVPGFDQDLTEFTKEDLVLSRIKTEEAYVKCPSCGCKITAENMCDPTHRQWIHTFPDLYKDRAGFNCSPLDVYGLNPPSRTLQQITNYELYDDWINFKVGKPFSNANAVLTQPQVNSQNTFGGNNFLGIDVGKTSWLVVINVAPNGMIKIIHLEYVKLVWEGDSTSTYNKVIELQRQYSIRGTVVDSMPDLSLSLSLISNSFNSYASEYTRMALNVEGSKSITNKREGIVKVWRTGLYNEMAKQLALNYITVAPSLPDIELFNLHLKGLKKVRTPDGGETWEKIGDDHFAHALGYALVASDRVVCNKIENRYESSIVGDFTSAQTRSPILSRSGRGIIY